MVTERRAQRLLQRSGYALPGDALPGQRPPKINKVLAHDCKIIPNRDSGQTESCKCLEHDKAAWLIGADWTHCYWSRSDQLTPTLAAQSGYLQFHVDGDGAPPLCWVKRAHREDYFQRLNDMEVARCSQWIHTAAADHGLICPEGPSGPSGAPPPSGWYERLPACNCFGLAFRSQTWGDGWTQSPECTLETDRTVFGHYQRYTFRSWGGPVSILEVNEVAGFVWGECQLPLEGGKRWDLLTLDHPDELACVKWMEMLCRGIVEISR